MGFSALLTFGLDDAIAERIRFGEFADHLVVLA
jgi:hypothetical protein